MEDRNWRTASPAAPGRLAVLVVQLRGPRPRGTSGYNCDNPRAAARAPTSSACAAPSLPAPKVDPVIVDLHDSHRDASLPGVGPVDRQVTIRQLQPSDEAAYCAFGGRVTWREGWHYPLFGLPGSDEHFRKTAKQQGQPVEGGGGELRLVLVEARTEEYEGRIYSWEEIYGEGWYTWKESNTQARPETGQPTSESEASTFGLCVNADFQGTGAGRALISRVLGVAEETGYGPPTMSLTVQDINQRAWELCESANWAQCACRSVLDV
eukprot:COSAG02_NODE_18_length_54986_cov_345.599322_31_plen_266_part_00